MDAQKIPFVAAWNTAARKKIQDAINQTGRALPASVVSVAGAIVTVKFQLGSVYTIPNVECPLFGPEYIRYPIQPGDKGVVFPADFHIGAMSGLGGGVADLSNPGNLAALVFFPIGNKTWGAVDPEAVTIYGPNGVVLKDSAGATTFTLTPGGVSVVTGGSWTIATPGCTFSLDAAGNFSLIGNVGGLVKAPGLKLSDTVYHTTPSLMATAWDAMVTYLNAHVHSTGSGNTGVPTAPFVGSNIALPGA